jgi:hypothetical protein
MIPSAAVLATPKWVKIKGNLEGNKPIPIKNFVS